MNINDALVRFLEYLEIEKGRSLKTVRNYRHYISRYLDIQNLKHTDDINASSLREFRLHLNRQEGIKIKGQAKGTMKKRTQNYYLIAIRMFLKYLIKIGIPVYSPDHIELAKTSDRQV